MFLLKTEVLKSGPQTSGVPEIHESKTTFILLLECSVTFYVVLTFDIAVVCTEVL